MEQGFLYLLYFKTRVNNINNLLFLSQKNKGMNESVGQYHLVQNKVPFSEQNLSRYSFCD